jgi:DNA-directed RNA polymerase subunit beta'
MPSATDFNAIRISLASPEQIKQWSYGEVTKPETINYRTLRPEKDGLFCERIFGPTKDWECYCGKYKKIRYKGVICDRCGVEVARAKVRRERMGHIALAAPVAHIWFSKGIPSRLGLLLDLTPRNLERVLYFAQYVVTSVNPLMRGRTAEAIDLQHAEQMESIEQQYSGPIAAVAAELDGLGAEDERRAEVAAKHAEMVSGHATAQSDAEEAMQRDMDDLDSIKALMLLTEARYRELNDKFGDVFHAGMGAEAILLTLREIDLDSVSVELENEVRTTSGQRRKKAVKRIRVVDAFRRSPNKAEWMVLTSLPVLPPDLRPMVQLDGGRFATSDLNDLYRRVINRNNRLRRLLDLGAPEIIVRNEKRMLQEAVDDLIDNGRRGRAIVGSHNHKLKSLSDLLRGKQGRFRQNLLGKRVDYGGRSVIVVGPSLTLGECGLPKKMALELFKPFVMNRLVAQGLAHNIKSAKRMVERTNPQVWDILEEVIKGRPVLLNRAPTLHRLGIQAFMPVLVEGSAIQLHPLVCAAFNADFDGDQMAVHVPLSREAVQEARNVMLSVNNMLSPSSGEPLVAPTYEIVLGCYYLTLIKEGAKGTGERYRDLADVMMAFDAGLLELQSEINVRDLSQPEGWMKTSPGRVIFNEVLPENLRRYNMVMDKKALKELVTETYHSAGNSVTANVLDSIKTMGFHYSTISGTTIGITDIKVPEEKAAMIAEADKKVEALQEQYEIGLITDRERESRTVAVWQGVNNAMDAVLQKHLPDFGGIYVMAHSGARGNEAQIKQMAAMRGLMSNPRGDIIELPIKSSFREGLTVLEYFISTHGARKGLADTALRTADSGYLTRRLIDVAQEVIVLEEDCGTDRGITIYADASEEEVMIAPLHERIVGRVVAEMVVHPGTGEILIGNQETIQVADAMAIELAEIKVISVRSPLTCNAPRGICRVCYGRSPASGKIANIGDAVGIIAAQSIGEPGTQLTMRTFHTGGVAGKDITSGLPRVEELFEARTPKGRARLAEIDGDVLIFEGGELVGEFKAEEDSVQVLVPPISPAPVIRIVSRIPFTDSYAVPETHKLVAHKGGRIHAGEPIATARAAAAKAASKDVDDTISGLTDLLARVSGVIRAVDGGIEIDSAEIEVRDHVVDATDQRLLHTGDYVVAGQKLTSGVKDPHDLLRIEGVDATRRYLVEQVQTVYRSQGVSINDKHIETIIRQILKWVRVETIGDTDMLPNQLVERVRFQSLNAKVMGEGGEPATSNPEILGVTRASLNTDSFLAKASFQETARVLTEAAILGETDYLRGLKENVIIGRLIPARLDLSPEGRELLGITEAQALVVAGEAPEPQDLSNLMMDYPGAEVPIGEDNEGQGHLNTDILEDDDDDDDDLMDGDDGEDDLADKPLTVAPEANVTESEESEENETIDEQSLESVLEEEAGDDEELESGI